MENEVIEGELDIVNIIRGRRLALEREGLFNPKFGLVQRKIMERHTNKDGKGKGVIKSGFTGIR